MSDLSEDEKKKEKEEKIKLEMFETQKTQKLKAAKEKESLHSQMAEKVLPKDCIIVVGTTGLGKSTCVNIFTGHCSTIYFHSATFLAYLIFSRLE